MKKNCSFHLVKKPEIIKYLRSDLANVSTLVIAMNDPTKQNESDVISAEPSSNILVVYYSRTGKTKNVAEDLVKSLRCDVEQIIDTKKRGGPIGFLSAGKDAGQGNLTTIEEPKFDPSKYNLVIIGTPVWNDTVSTPVRTYLFMHKEKIANAAFFLTQDRKESETFGEMSTSSRRCL